VKKLKTYYVVSRNTKTTFI